MFHFLTIAGFDNSGGAGLQADIKIATLMGGMASTVATAFALQNSQGVADVHHLPTAIIEKQLDLILQDSALDVIKIGMLDCASHIHTISDLLRQYPRYPLILDPVLVSSSGKLLLEPQGIDALKRLLCPQTLCITPNIPELACLTGRDIIDDSSEQQAVQDLLRYGVKSVLVKGGHRTDTDYAVDRLYESAKIYEYASPRFAYDVHGTGCALSSLMACYIAQDYDLHDAVRYAKQKMHELFQNPVAMTKGYYFHHHFRE